MSEPDRFRGLFLHVANRQDGLLDGHDSEPGVRQRLAEHAARGTRSGALRDHVGVAWRYAVLSLIVVCAGAVALWRAKPDAPPMSFTVGDPPSPGNLGDLASASDDHALPLRFSEGTTIVLRPDARGRVVAVRARGADMILEAGRARVEVVPRPGGDWSVRAGPFAVRVTGTKFEIEYDPAVDAFSLELEEGKVLVSGCGFGEGRLVEAGRRATASCSRREMSVTPLDARADLPEHSASATVDPIPPAPPASFAEPREPRPVERSQVRGEPAMGRETRTWWELAREGRYSDAFELAREGFEEHCRRDGQAQVLLLGDAARLSGHAVEARRAYTLLRERFPGSPQAAQAAFGLGRLALYADADGVAAEHWFETHLRERPHGPLASLALGRILELRLQRGDAAGAAAIAREYLERYPTGPNAQDARKVLAAHGGEATR
jgi:transmembrane sensor